MLSVRHITHKLRSQSLNEEPSYITKVRNKLFSIFPNFLFLLLSYFLKEIRNCPVPLLFVRVVGWWGLFYIGLLPVSEHKYPMHQHYSVIVYSVVEVVVYSKKGGGGFLSI
jgi:hypothetical protein